MWARSCPSRNNSCSILEFLSSTTPNAVSFPRSSLFNPPLAEACVLGWGGWGEGERCGHESKAGESDEGQLMICFVQCAWTVPLGRIWWQNYTFWIPDCGRERKSEARGRGVQQGVEPLLLASHSLYVNPPQSPCPSLAAPAPSFDSMPSSLLC